jgi:hypothetical protein
VLLVIWHSGNDTEFYLVKPATILLLSFAFATIISQLTSTLYPWLQNIYLTPIILVYTYAKGENVGGAAVGLTVWHFSPDLQT